MEKYFNIDTSLNLVASTRVGARVECAEVCNRNTSSVPRSFSELNLLLEMCLRGVSDWRHKASGDSQVPVVVAVA